MHILCMYVCMGWYTVLPHPPTYSWHADTTALHYNICWLLFLLLLAYCRFVVFFHYFVNIMTFSAVIVVICHNYVHHTHIYMYVCICVSACGRHASQALIIACLFVYERLISCLYSHVVLDCKYSSNILVIMRGK